MCEAGEIDSTLGCEWGRSLCTMLHARLGMRWPKLLEEAHKARRRVLALAYKRSFAKKAAIEAKAAKAAKAAEAAKAAPSKRAVAKANVIKKPASNKTRY